jgi:hypothetical protein
MCCQNIWLLHCAVFSVRECYVTSSIRTKYEMRSFSFFIFFVGERKEKKRKESSYLIPFFVVVDKMRKLDGCTFSIFPSFVVFPTFVCS